MKNIRRLVSDGRDVKRIKLQNQSPPLFHYNDASSMPGFLDMFASDDEEDTFYKPKLIDYHHDVPLTPQPNFNLGAIPEQVLSIEIFPRLADSRTAIRCSAVCKHWNSLLTAPEFVPEFLRRHRECSYAIFVGFTFRIPTTEIRTWNGETKTIRELCPRTLMVAGRSNVTGSASDYNFTLTSHPLALALDSTCDDFLLLSRVSTDVNWNRIRCLYVQNAPTGRRLKLPDPPLEDQSGFSAIVSHADSTPSRYGFWVVYFTRSRVDTPDEFQVTVFNSETGQWSDPSEAYRPPNTLDVMAANGLLYWVDLTGYIRLIIFDPSTSLWRIVKLPDGLCFPSADHLLVPPPPGPPSQYVFDGMVFGPMREPFLQATNKYRASLGVVQGRVQLAQLLQMGVAGFFVMRVWELSCDNSTWGPATEFRVKHPPAKGRKRLYLLSLHPEDSDIVFLCCDCDVYTYRLSSGEYTGPVFALSCTKGDDDPRVGRCLPHFAHVHTLRLPPWPTTMPSLP